MESPFEIPAQNLENWLGLDSHPVAVFLLRDAGGSKWTGFRAIRRHRYCQAVMWARRGHKVLLTGEQLVCPA